MPYFFLILIEVTFLLVKNYPVPVVEFSSFKKGVSLTRNSYKSTAF